MQGMTQHLRLLACLLLSAAAMACSANPEAEESATVTEAVEAPAAAQIPAAKPADVPAFTWEIEKVDAGTSPALTLGSDGEPRLVYAKQQGGGVGSAVRDESGWQITTIAEGEFAGFLHVATDDDGAAHVSYHSGQPPRMYRGRFRRLRGDTSYAVLRGREWELQTTMGRDRGGFDNSIAVDSSGRPHVSAVKPFGRTHGLEYLTVDHRGLWVVEPIETGFQSWDDTSSIAIDPFGAPHVTYFDTGQENLALASRSEAGWNLDIIDEEKGTGRNSSLVIDDTGRFHVSYLMETGTTSAAVKYGSIGMEDSRWEIQVVGIIEDLSLPWRGPQRLTSLALDRSNRPWIAYTDEKTVALASWDGASWRTETVAETDGATLGKIVSLKIGPDGLPHVAYFELAGENAETGSIRYAKGTRR